MLAYGVTSPASRLFLAFTRLFIGILSFSYRFVGVSCMFFMDVSF